MSNIPALEFGDDSVARAYDNGLVPVLFHPWAEQIVADHMPWSGKCVLDLATGTGIVAHLVGKELGAAGKLVGADLNAEMMALAEERCAELEAETDFVVCSADSLECPSASMDRVICQQGFQFFPDKARAAREIYRVLNVGGTVFISTWRPVEECQFFGAMCESLEAIGQHEASTMMRIPFDHMPTSELEAYFKAAGFSNIQMTRPSKGFVLNGGDEHVIEIAYSTPIGPKLNEWPAELQAQFKAELLSRTRALSGSGSVVGQMVSDVLTATKPS